ncbi:hypothetical protein M409DRAFT_58421 [Zasmidium cellare ATCC 36951]|uniref:BZIP domain-containing protein n=1 Tax=Zasmidium cellare ATCC 36951 TaxID=1080233 RepID=A0A6A6C7Y7_ZASCE|nr:uncharacterized protein M409DRAFT_58421 [Zasmidium cellare ATCC 36951]KAF2162320.1 hypothetical protein M409DRAFT_58421 [Zasmidium cellare ATCC 36951]
MTSHPSTYLWDPEMPNLLVDDIQDYQQQALQPLWPWGYDPSGYEPHSENSMPSTPDSSYHDTSLELPFYNPEDLIDLQRIGTPMSDQEPAVNVDTTGTGANKRIRRREQNRASQRAYRDRQRGKIAELQSKVVALQTQNEKLLARNNMLEAAFQRDRPQTASGHPTQQTPTSQTSNHCSTSQEWYGAWSPVVPVQRLQRSQTSDMQGRSGFDAEQ